MISSNRIKALVSLHLDFSGKETAKIEIASDLTRYGSGRTKSAGAKSWVASRRCVLPLCG